MRPAPGQPHDAVSGTDPCEEPAGQPGGDFETMRGVQPPIVSGLTSALASADDPWGVAEGPHCSPRRTDPGLCRGRRRIRDAEAPQRCSRRGAARRAWRRRSGGIWSGPCTRRGTESCAPRATATSRGPRTSSRAPTYAGATGPSARCRWTFWRCGPTGRTRWRDAGTRYGTSYRTSALATGVPLRRAYVSRSRTSRSARGRYPGPPQQLL